MQRAQPIIVIKKKGGHGGHHGGAWKVAYADFVTAMMALFIVLWLLNSSKQIQVAVGGYFRDPNGTSKKVGTNKNGSGQNFTLKKEDISKLKDQLQQAMKDLPDFEKLQKQIELKVTAEGLRIELLESANGTFFDSGSPKASQDGVEILTLLAKELSALPNKVAIEGHTDAKPYSSDGKYSNWELSVDRANAARRLMQTAGLRTDQVSQVRGYADQLLRVPENPLEPSNRRITLIVQYLPKNDDEDAPAAAAAGDEKGVKSEPAPNQEAEHK
jgi:chemotaxis protein MotB